MLRIGITAGIGAGKSTICKIFNEKFLVPIYNMDVRAKALVNEIEELEDALVEHFGPETLVDGLYNPKHVADIIFKNDDERKWLQHTIGKYMKVDYDNWCKENKRFPYTIMESAILLEASCDHWVDLIIGVDCPKPICIERVQKRNNFTAEQVIERMNAQMKNELKMKACDFIIVNDGSAELEPQVKSLHRILSRIYLNIDCRAQKLGAQGVGYGLGVAGKGTKPDGTPNVDYIMDIANAFLNEYSV